MKRAIKYSVIILLFLLCATPPAIAKNRLPKETTEAITLALQRITLQEVAGSYAKVNSTKIKGSGKRGTIEIYTSVELAYYPMRPGSVERIYNDVRKAMPEKYRNYTIKIYSSGELIENLIPQY